MAAQNIGDTRASIMQVDQICKIIKNVNQIREEQRCKRIKSEILQRCNIFRDGILLEMQDFRTQR